MSILFRKTVCLSGIADNAYFTAAKQGVKSCCAICGIPAALHMSM
jgi:hypothetical protein